MKKLPRVKELSAEYGRVLGEKRELFQEYKEVRKEMQTWEAARENTKQMLDIDEKKKGRAKEKKHDERSER